LFLMQVECQKWEARAAEMSVELNDLVAKDSSVHADKVQDICTEMSSIRKASAEASSIFSSLLQSDPSLASHISAVQKAEESRQAPVKSSKRLSVGSDEWLASMAEQASAAPSAGTLGSPLQPAAEKAIKSEHLEPSPTNTEPKQAHTPTTHSNAPSTTAESQDDASDSAQAASQEASPSIADSEEVSPKKRASVRLSMAMSEVAASPSRKSITAIAEFVQETNGEELLNDMLAEAKEAAIASAVSTRKSVSALPAIMKASSKDALLEFSESAVAVTPTRKSMLDTAQKVRADSMESFSKAAEQAKEATSKEQLEATAAMLRSTSQEMMESAQAATPTRESVRTSVEKAEQQAMSRAEMAKAEALEFKEQSEKSAFEMVERAKAATSRQSIQATTDLLRTTSKESFSEILDSAKASVPTADSLKARSKESLEAGLGTATSLRQGFTDSLKDAAAGAQSLKTSLTEGKAGRTSILASVSPSDTSVSDATLRFQRMTRRVTSILAFNKK